MTEKSNFSGDPQKCLFEAARTGDVKMFLWSLQHGADLNARTMPGGIGYSVADLAHNYCQDSIVALLKRSENADALARSLDEGSEGYGEPL